MWHRQGQCWVQPGGHLEEGEASFEQAARREVTEEIGLEGLERVGAGPAVLHRHTLDAAFGRCEEHWDVQYLLRAPAPACQLPLTACAETTEELWVLWSLLAVGKRRQHAAMSEVTLAVTLAARGMLVH